MRLTEAVAASAVSTDRILDVRYDADGALTTAWFQLQDDSVTEDWAYLYDPPASRPPPTTRTAT